MTATICPLGVGRRAAYWSMSERQSLLVRRSDTKLERRGTRHEKHGMGLKLAEGLWQVTIMPLLLSSCVAAVTAGC